MSVFAPSSSFCGAIGKCRCNVEAIGTAQQLENGGTMLRLSLQLHKLIALIVAIQVLGWVAGGLIMTAIPIEQVRGEQHIGAAALPPINIKRLLPLEKQLALADMTDVGEATLKNTPRGPIWVLKSAAGSEGWWNAYSGENVDEIAKADARRYAQMAYKGDGKLLAVDYEETAPKEAQVSGPLWRASFGDREHTRLYLDAFTGEVLSRRSNLWAFYDFFYQIHIMNFGASRSYNHPLIVTAAAATLMVVVTGIVLLVLRLRTDLRRLWAARLGRGAPATPIDQTPSA
ncbi:MAG TPA: PepSY domain-containing protein [Phenylobacterium sp.]|nr:PepSY domain-containing protein [Phenylobacterium sp.]